MTPKTMEVLRALALHDDSRCSLTFGLDDYSTWEVEVSINGLEVVYVGPVDFAKIESAVVEYAINRAHEIQHDADGEYRERCQIASKIADATTGVLVLKGAAAPVDDELPF